MIDYTVLITFLVIAVVILSIVLGWLLACRISDIRYQNAITRYLKQYGDDEETEEGEEHPEPRVIEVNLDDLPEELQELLQTIEEGIPSEEQEDKK